jgi:hypothetical protein
MFLGDLFTNFVIMGRGDLLRSDRTIQGTAIKWPGTASLQVILVGGESTWVTPINLLLNKSAVQLRVVFGH